MAEQEEQIRFKMQTCEHISSKKQKIIMVKKEKEPMNVERHINHCMNHSNKKKTVAYLNIANSVKLTEARMSIGRDTVQFLGHTSSVINNFFIV